MFGGASRPLRVRAVDVAGPGVVSDALRLPGVASNHLKIFMILEISTIWDIFREFVRADRHTINVYRIDGITRSVITQQDFKLCA